MVFRISAQHLSLLVDFTRREIAAKYKSSLLGGVWAVLSPVLMWLVYAIVFSMIFRVYEYGGIAQTQTDYLLSLFLGLSVFLFFSEVIVAAPDLIARRPNFVKKVVFPLWILVASRVFVATFALVINIVLLLIVVAATQYGLSYHTLLIPVILFGICLFSYGVALTFASIGVFVPDVSQAIRPVVRSLFYLAPIVYPITLVPDEFQLFIWLNPITSMTEFMRAFVLGRGPLPWVGLGLFLLAATFVYGLGLVVFKRLRPGFADVI